MTFGSVLCKRLNWLKRFHFYFIERTMKIISALALLSTATASRFGPALAFAAKVGDKVPSVNVHSGFPPDMVNIADYVKGKNTIIVGLPGAFTPT